MDCNSDNPMPNPKRLKTLAFHTKFPRGNNLLHQFVLENSDPNPSGSTSFINAVLLSMINTVTGNEPNNDGYSALHLAVLKNNLVMVKKLLSCLVNIDLNAKCGLINSFNTALHLASSKGYISIVEELLSKGAAIDIENLYSKTPLLLAVVSGHQDVIKLLVKKGADLNPKSVRHPLHYAYSNIEVMKILLSNGVAINAENIYALTALHYAAYYGNLDSVQFLIRNGADVNARSKYGCTPLHCAARSRNLEVVKCLISYGADINTNDKFGDTALHWAAQSGDLAVVEFMYGNGALVTPYKKWSILCPAVSSGNLDVVNFFLDRGVQLDIKGGNGHELLCRAVRSRNLKIISFLVNKGADVNAKNEFGHPPLNCADAKLKEEILKLLIEKGDSI